MASEYGSCPVEPAAHQIRMLLRPALACRGFGHDRIAEMIERHLVAKKECLVGGHGFDHLGDDGGRAAFHFLHEFADAWQPAFARQRKQAAFDEILLVCGQVETGIILQELAQILVIGRGHGRPLKGKRNRF
jgi:hypothetical protein